MFVLARRWDRTMDQMLRIAHGANGRWSQKMTDDGENCSRGVQILIS